MDHRLGESRIFAPIEIPTASPIARPEVELPPAVGIAFNEGTGEEPEAPDAGIVLGIVICVGDVGIAFDEKNRKPPTLGPS